jgi:hypothetical protein
MREKNEMTERRCMCVVGEKKKERQGGTWVVGKKKKKEIKKKKRNREWGLHVWWGKRESGKERRKKFEREKTKLVLFICSFCLVQSVEL